MDVVVGLVLSLLIGAPLAALVSSRIRNRLERSGKYEVALRVVSGAEDGLGPKWRHGKASAAPGILTFEGGGPLGARFPRSGRYQYSVVEAVIDGDRAPKAREAWSINPSLRIATVRTPSAVLDLAASPESLRAFVRALDPTRSEVSK
ncbi:MAG: hypothetical protein ACTHJM_10225 [Marmoricola sp.]